MALTQLTRLKTQGISFGYTAPLKLKNGLVIAPDNLEYPKLSAFGFVYELPYNGATYQVASFVKLPNDNCTITLSTGGTVTAYKLNVISRFWVEQNAKVIANGGTLPRTLASHFGDVVNLKDYLDAGEDQTNACLRVSSVINSRGGGVVLIPSGTYRVGKQSSGGALFRTDDPIFHFKDCTNPITIICGGSTFKVNDNLYFGSFDPATGERHNGGENFVDLAYRADAYSIIQADNCESISISSVILDGNGQNCNLGGIWGDKGRQCVGTGITLRNCNIISLQNVISINNPLDGIMVTGFGSLEQRRRPNQTSLVNVYCDTNGRQGCSLTQSKSTLVTGSHFKNTGRLVHKSGEIIASNPNSGFDIEAEGGSLNRSCHIINSSFTNNVGTGCVADTGDSSGIIFDGCLFYSPDSVAVWPNKPNIKFNNCEIIGQVVSIYDDTLFENCLFTDKKDDMTVVASQYTHNLVDTAGRAPVFSNCRFDLHVMRMGNFQSAASLGKCVKLLNCTVNFKIDTSVMPDKSFILILNNVYAENFNIIQDYQGASGAEGYYIEIAGFDRPCKIEGEIFYKAPTGIKMRWGSTSAGAGTAGRIDTSAQYLYVNTMSHRASFYGMTKIGSFNALPTNGDFNRGDIIYNSNPASGSHIGWSCLVSSTNGTGAVFKPFGKIE